METVTESWGAIEATRGDRDRPDRPLLYPGDRDDRVKFMCDHIETTPGDSSDWDDRNVSHYALFPDQNSLLSLTLSKYRRAAVILTPPYLWKKSKNMNAYTINFAWIAKISSYGWIAGKKLGKSFRLLQTKRKISTTISAIAIDLLPSLIPSGGKILNSDPGLAQYTQAIGAIKWKQWIAQIAYTLFRAIGAIGAIGAIIWKPGLRDQGDDDDDNDVK